MNTLSKLRYSVLKGASLSIILALFACQKEELKPVAYFSVFPSFGDSRTVFYFDARTSIDNEPIDEGLMVRWDWESDSVWDTPYSLEKEVARRFEISNWYFVTMQVMDHSGNTALYTDTINVWSSFPESGQLIDPRDGQAYETVKFKEQWIMRENLRYGSWIQDTVMPSQYTGPEFYLYDNDENNLKYGGLYTWYETMNYKEVVGGQGICPEGWHVPSFQEWNTLIGFEYYYEAVQRHWAFGMPVPINIVYYYGQDSPSGLELLFLGYGKLSNLPDGQIVANSGINESVGFWTSHPLTFGYYGDKKQWWSLNMQLSKYSYGIKYGPIIFDPLISSQQTLSLHYVRCFKD